MQPNGYDLLAVVVALTYWFLLPHARFRRPTAQFALDTREEARGSGERVGLSLLLPLQCEPEVAGPVERILQSDHDDFEILLIVDHFDREIAAARRVAEEHPDRVRLLLTSGVTTKAAALNFAIPHCRGDVTGVIGGDNLIGPGLLAAVEAAFLTTRVDVITTGVQVRDGTTGPDLHANLDRTTHLAGARPLRLVRHFYPIADDAYFIRTDLLRLLGGWDDDCTIEATEVALRLSSYGAIGGVLYGPTVWVESYGGGGARRLFMARVRRYAGLLRIHSTGEWRRFPSARDRRAARRGLLLPVVRAVAGLWLAVLAVACSVAGGILELRPGRLPWGAGGGPLVLCGATGGLMLLLAMAMDLRALLWQSRQCGRPRPTGVEVVVFLASWPVHLLLACRAATQALWRHLRSETRELTEHFERSREAPARPEVRPHTRRDGAEDGAGGSDIPPDLLGLAQNRDLPAAASAMAEGLDRLFRSLGPPPDSLRLDGTGPRPQGGGGASGD
ncbi:glycosyltransferase family 2 protein [Streptomyces purpurascens]|uniref:glycosyltransferase family 2 protein n=1 Tax=Streptomyces purpurascens TaxID=1924 RepID=UPI003C2C6BE2